MTMVIPKVPYQWSHSFVGNATKLAPHLELTMNNEFYGRVFAQLRVYMKHNDIHVSFGLWFHETPQYSTTDVS